MMVTIFGARFLRASFPLWVVAVLNSEKEAELLCVFAPPWLWRFWNCAVWGAIAKKAAKRRPSRFGV